VNTHTPHALARTQAHRNGRNQGRGLGLSRIELPNQQDVWDLGPGVDAGICIEGVGGGTSDDGENDLVVSGELALTGGGVDQAVGGSFTLKRWGILCTIAGGSELFES
jgi:hypothetical protein